MFDSQTYQATADAAADTARTSKPLAKSLHTVTVVVNLARYLEKTEGLGPWVAVHTAANILGLSGLRDTYGLLEQAHKKLSK